MAVYSGPEIVNDGLILHLDAANARSYPGSGTIWNDLSGFNSICTLANGATISNNALFLDGIDDIARITAWPNTSSTTGFYVVEMLARWRSGTGDMFMGFSSYDIYTPSNHLGFNTGNADVYGINSSRVNQLGLVGSWAHYAFIFNTQIQNNEIWINGFKETLSQQLGSTNLIATRSFSSQVNIGSWPNNNSYPPFLDVAYFRIYNRKLNEAEIKQNFEATKSRYSI